MHLRAPLHQSVNFHRGFSPQQWVLGKAMNYAHGLSGEIFNPGEEALDDQGAFANVQPKRVNAAQASFELTLMQNFAEHSPRSLWKTAMKWW